MDKLPIEIVEANEKTEKLESPAKSVASGWQLDLHERRFKGGAAGLRISVHLGRSSGWIRYKILVGLCGKVASEAEQGDGQEWIHQRTGSVEPWGSVWVEGQFRGESERGGGNSRDFKGDDGWRVLQDVDQRWLWGGNREICQEFLERKSHQI